MTAQQLVHQLMCDIGPLVGAQQVTSGPAPDCWQVVLDRQAVFDFEYDAVLERVVISSHVGALPAEGRLGLCELLLKVNAGWRESGGVRMALDLGGEDVLMMFELPVARLELSLLSTVLASLRAKHDVWREMLV